MIDFIEGSIVAKEAQKLVLMTGGVGFDIKVSTQTLSSLPASGERALVYTNLLLREDDISLYGFISIEERSFFELLIQVSGIGPKLALGILSTYPVLTVKKAIVTGDVAMLSSISGIGKKTAQRLSLELKDKLGKEMLDGSDEIGFSSSVDAGEGDLAQAIQALEALGYGRAEIIRAFSGRELAGMSVEDIIKLGLRLIARY